MRIAVIGGGASGLVASIFAKDKNNEVVVFERNSCCGKKMLITGNGKCNYWNENQELSHYHSMENDFLKEIITEDNRKKVLDFLKQIGIVPKIKNGYFYPMSGQASSIRNALYFEAIQKNVVFSMEKMVKDVSKEGKFFLIETEHEKFTFDKVILATGGTTFSKTGSDGMGYDIAKKFGHTIVTPVPSLVQLITEGSFLKKWAGVRVEAEASIYEENQFLKSEIGEIQLTDYGVSGICIFNLSRYASLGLLSKKRMHLKIDFLPLIKEDILDFLETQNRCVENRSVGDLLECLLNYKLVDVILKEVGISRNACFQELNERQKKLLKQYLKAFPLSILGTKDFESAQVTCGGVSLREIHLKTFESKKVKDLYIVGELLDVDGDCGGYNLGFAWISGMLAGSDARDEKKI